ncbi:MAG: threonine/serine exporter family protein [Mycolicibacterium sp.]|nr:threonine/serine exporter family protein [Mycolicibacterium sp.]
MLAAAACAAFAFLNNGGWAECLVVFGAVACGRVAQLVLARQKVNQLACVLVAAAISCTVYVTVTTGIRHLDPGAAGLHASAFTSAVLLLVPGFPLLTAALDLARSDLAAGIQRLTYAGLIIFSAGLGAWMVVAVSGVLPAATPGPGHRPGRAGRAAAGRGLRRRLRVRRRVRHAVAVRGRGGLHRLGGRYGAADRDRVVPAPAVRRGRRDLRDRVAAAFVSRYLRSPRIVLSVPAALIMIPGAATFRALVFLNDGQITLAMANGVQAALIVASLTTGLVIARVVSDRNWTMD